MLDNGPSCTVDSSTNVNVTDWVAAVATNAAAGTQEPALTFTGASPSTAAVADPLETKATFESNVPIVERCGKLYVFIAPVDVGAIGSLHVPSSFK